MKSSVSTSRLLGRCCRCAAAQRSPQAREQLLHVERLGDVVIGSGVEGGDLVAAVVAGREDEDRHGGPAAEAADHVDATDPGKSEVEDDDVRMVSRGQEKRLLPGRRDVDVVATGPQVDRHRPQDRLLVVDDEDSAHVAVGKPIITVVPPPGVSSMLDRRPHRNQEAVGDGETEADAAGSAITEALERLEHPLPVGCPHSWSAVNDADLDAPVEFASPRRGPVRHRR